MTSDTQHAHKLSERPESLCVNCPPRTFYSLKREEITPVGQVIVVWGNGSCGRFTNEPKCIPTEKMETSTPPPLEFEKKNEDGEKISHASLLPFPLTRWRRTRDVFCPWTFKNTTWSVESCAVWSFLRPFRGEERRTKRIHGMLKAPKENKYCKRHRKKGKQKLVSKFLRSAFKKCQSKILKVFSKLRCVCVTLWSKDPAWTPGFFTWWG